MKDKSDHLHSDTSPPTKRADGPPSWLLADEIFYISDADYCTYFVDQGLFGEEYCKYCFALTRWDRFPYIPCIFCGQSSTHYELNSTHGDLKCPNCRKMYNYKTGTFLGGSKLGYAYWWRLVYLLTTAKKPLSSHYVAWDLKVTQKTAYYMMQTIAKAMGIKDFQSPLHILASDWDILDALSQSNINQK